MIQHLIARGLSPPEIETIRNSITKDKNGFARGFLGPERYRDMKLRDFDLNDLPKVYNSERE